MAEEIYSLGGQVVSGGLSGRTKIWRNSWDLISGRQWFGFEELSLASVRPLIGYGPDLFRNVYLLESLPEPPRLLPGEPDQAHNFVIHQSVEAGLLGALASLGLFVVPLVVGGYLLLWRGSDFSTLHKLLLAGMVAVLAGRFMEQIVGVARVSDLTVWWVLLAIYVVVPRAIERQPESPETAASSRDLEHRSRIQRKGVFSDRRQLLWRGAAATGLIVGIVLITWVKTIDYPRAAVLAAEAGVQFHRFEFQGAISSLDRAIDLAPDVSSYYVQRAEVYRAYPLNNRVAPERGCSVPGNSLPYGECLAAEAYSADLEGVNRRPYQFRQRLALADSGLTLGFLRRDADLVNESLEQYRQVVDMMPNSWTLLNRLAEVYVRVGQPEAALPALEKSLALTGGTTESIDAQVIKGSAYRSLGQYQLALEQLNEVINATGSIRAYNERAVIYYEIGDFELALQNYNLAIIDESIPEYRAPETYVGRALTYTQLGRDAEAERDAERAVQLGFDGALLRSVIDEIKKSR